MRGDLRLVVAGPGKPLQAQAGLKLQGDHSASLVEEHNGLPTQVAGGNPLEFGAALDNAACRGEVCKASIAVGDLGKSDWSGRRLMDL
jgi:hypothetical protein